ncbi:MAG: A/G-specific adenine glycosylase [Bacteroidales bacterium]|nr:A/G-specific adenine glycosylase [Bacteroidales bacterium]
MTGHILAKWYAENRRDLPWRSHPSPYFVWISEVILQQTRVSQGYDYFMRFTERWPSLKDLAAASEEEVLKMWQGLGYYSRARNLHRCAQQVVEQHGGAFPADFDALRKLQGIGDYTAAAIASIAFNLPHAVVDGNVYRVLSRLFDIDTPINNKEGQNVFSALAQALLDPKQPGLHNQAMMEFGALHCVPQNPDCLHCPLQARCLAFAHQTVGSRPVKINKIKPKTRYFNYLVIRIEGTRQIYLHQRKEKDIWNKLYDFPLVESDEAINIERLIQTDAFKKIVGNCDFSVGKTSPVYTHKLTHQTIVAQFTEIFIRENLATIETKDIILASEMDLEQYPIPRLIDLYLNP